MLVYNDEEIDFSKFQVIAFFDKVKMNWCWSIDVTNVRFEKDEIIIKVENKEKGCGLSSIAQPYEIVKIPASKKNIVVDMNLFEYPR